MKKNILRAFFAFSFLLIYGNSFSQYKIRFTIPDFAGDTLLFGHYFNESLMLQDSFFLDSHGRATIAGDKNLLPGMYTVYMPNKTRFDLMIDDDQKFRVSTDTAGFIANTVIKGSKENHLFYEYLKYLDKKRKETKGLQERFTSPQSAEDSIAARQELEAVNEEVKKFVEGIIDEADGSFLSSFLLSMKEIEVPEPPKDEDGNLIDKNFQAKYFKQHYFDYFDISDVRLLRTPVYEKKIITYLDRWVYPVPDSIYREVDFLIEKSRSDTLLFKYMLTTVFNYYAKSKYVGMDAVYAYIAEKYYIPEASWSSREFINQLRERVEKISPLTIGKKGPDIKLVQVSDDHFQFAAEDTSAKRNPYVGDFFNLYDVEASFIILYFWEADCGHCKKAIPEFHEIYERLKDEGLKVIAVSMLGGIEGKEKWIDFINENGLYGWINAWNPYDFSYKDAYDVTSSNILYLLDSEKTIVAKRIAPEQVEEIIRAELGLDKKEPKAE